MNRTISVLLGSLLIGAILSVTMPLLHAQQSTNGTPRTLREAPPILTGALHDLEQARHKLANARTFGGHKEAALKAVDEAIREVEAGIKFDEEKH